jgi:hypothetical protein
MAVNYKSLAMNTYIPNAVGALYTGGTNEQTVIHNLTVTNISAGAVTFTLHLYPSGGTASDTNTFTKAKSLAANETFVVPAGINLVIPAGAVLAGVASAANSININISGVVKT